MGWTVYYALKRHAPLTPEERESILRHVEASRVHPWTVEAYALELPETPVGDVVASGATKVPYDLGNDDTEELIRLLNELLRLVPGAEFDVEDDLDLIGWVPALGRVDWKEDAEERAKANEPPTEGERVDLRVEEPGGGLVTIDPATLQMHLRQTEFEDELDLRTTLRTTTTRPVRHVETSLILRDSEGSLLDMDTRGIHDLDGERREKLRFTVGRRVFQRCASFELRAAVRERSEVTIFSRAVTPPPASPERAEWPLGRGFLRAFALQREAGKELRLQFLAEIERDASLPLGPEATLEIQIADPSGAIIDAGSANAVTMGGGAIFAHTTWVSADRAGRAARVTARIRTDLVHAIALARCSVVTCPPPPSGDKPLPIF